MLAQFTLPETFVPGVIGTIIFAIIGMLGLSIGFKLLDWAMKKVDFQEQLNRGNMAVAAVLSAFFISLAIILAHVVH
jgi:uncharacterized membrane protein YjfL (UPF0719 family)